MNEDSESVNCYVSIFNIDLMEKTLKYRTSENLNLLFLEQFMSWCKILSLHNQISREKLDFTGERLMTKGLFESIADETVHRASTS